jgi:hypothetical protein
VLITTTETITPIRPGLEPAPPASPPGLLAAAREELEQAAYLMAQAVQAAILLLEEEKQPQLAADVLRLARRLRWRDIEAGWRGLCVTMLSRFSASIVTCQRLRFLPVPVRGERRSHLSGHVVLSEDAGGKIRKGSAGGCNWLLAEYFRVAVSDSREQSGCVCSATFLLRLRPREISLDLSKVLRHGAARSVARPVELARRIE